MMSFQTLEVAGWFDDNKGLRPAKV